MTDGLGGWDEGVASRVDPLVYPGRWPPRSVLLTDAGLLPLHPLPGRRIGQALVHVRHGSLPSSAGDDGQAPSEVPLDDVLLRHDVARADDRVPVLAVGSNGSPAQIRHKYEDARVSLTIPMVKAQIEGLDVVMAPGVARAGYVPATPIIGPGLASELFVHWLDPAQLVRLDLTEPIYHRILIGPDPADGGVRITLPSGEELGACYAYTCVDGHLTVGDGDATVPLEMTDQATILETLLAASPRLRDLLGDTPTTWVRTFATDPGLRLGMRGIFAEEGLIRRSEIIDRLVAEQDAPRGGPLDPDARPRPHALAYGRIVSTRSVPGGTRTRPAAPPGEATN